MSIPDLHDAGSGPRRHDGAVLSGPLPAFPCRDCTQSCCAEFTVFITPFDLRRIAATLELPPDRLVTPIPCARGNAGYRPYSFSLGGRRRFLLSLRRRRAGCPFLLRFGKLGRCGIHPLRPQMCRCYPYSAEDGEIREIAQSRCPPGKVLSPSDRSEIREAFAAMTGDFLLYKEFLDLWHDRRLPQLRQENGFRRDSPSALAAFLAFMGRQAETVRP